MVYILNQAISKIVSQELSKRSKLPRNALINMITLEYLQAKREKKENFSIEEITQLAKQKYALAEVLGNDLDILLSKYEDPASSSYITGHEMIGILHIVISELTMIHLESMAEANDHE